VTTAVDTNIILDILIPDEPFAASSKALLERHLAAGQLIFCEVVLAGLAGLFPSEEELDAFLTGTGMRMVRSDDRSLYVAGRRWAAYASGRKKGRLSCRECGKTFKAVCPRCGAALKGRFHVLADFLVGAHALTHADCLLTRDLGIYKSYFKDLKVAG
jgi:hypothetical protein